MTIKALPVVGMLLAAAACSEPDPVARTDDLWPGFRRAAAKGAPGAAEIENACQEAFGHFKEEAEKTPGTYIDPSYFDYPVRNPVCRPEAGAASTLQCRFEQAEIMIEFPSPEQRREQLARMKDRDWTPYRVRLVFVRQPLGGARWIAPAGCEPLSAAASPEAP